MAAELPDEDQARFMGCRKQDQGQNWALVVVRVNNLQNPRDVVVVTLPTSRDLPLMVRLNDRVIFEQLLPGDIVVGDCEHTTHCGKTGEVEIKLRKAEPGEWMDRWSPSRN